MLNGGAIMSCALILNLIQPRSGLADKYDFLYNCLHKIGGMNCVFVQKGSKKYWLIPILLGQTSLDFNYVKPCWDLV